VVVKTILYKRTISLGTSMDFKKDLRRCEPRGDSGGSGLRKEAVKTGGRTHELLKMLNRKSKYAFTDRTKQRNSSLDLPCVL